MSFLSPSDRSSEQTVDANSLASQHCAIAVRPFWNELAGLRTVSFLTVFFYHYGPPPVPADSFLGYVLLHLFDKLFVGVDVFFVLSGFLITSLLLDERKRKGDVSLRQFYLRRTLRIFPPYFAILLFAAAAPVFIIGQANLPMLWYYYKKLLLPATFFFANFALIKHHLLLDRITDLVGLRLTALIMPLWSLCVEEHFYTIWAPTFKLLKTATLLKVICLIAIASSVAFKIYFWHLSTQTPDDWTTFYKWFYNSLCRMDGLMLGSLTAIGTFERGEIIRAFCIRNKMTLLTLLVAFFLCLVFAVPRLIFNTPVFLFAEILLPWFISLALLLIISLPRLKALFASKILVALAKYSYSGYLVHYFILQTVFGALQQFAAMKSTGLGYVVGLTVSLCLTLTVSHISWMFLESKLAKIRMRFAE